MMHHSLTQEAPAKTWNAKDYHRHSTIQYELALELLTRYSFRGDERVLDVGCGDGKVTAEIAAKVPFGHVLGVDNASSMIDFAQQRFSRDEFGNLDFGLQDAASLAYEEEFDVVFSFLCLHWVKDQPAALKGIYNGLKPGGSFYAILLAALNFMPAIQKAIKEEPWKAYFPVYTTQARVYSVSEYQQLLQQANFIPLSVQRRDALMVFSDKGQLVNWIKQLLSMAQKLPAELRDPFAEDVVDALLTIYSSAIQPSGDIHIPLPVLEVEALRN